MTDICIGPAGGCPQCYRMECICGETDAERELREARERKREKAHGHEIELLKCNTCQQFGVVPDNVRREYICLKCGKAQIGYKLATISRQVEALEAEWRTDMKVQPNADPAYQAGWDDAEVACADALQTLKESLK